jgi:acetolactate synthase small subunit
MADKKGQEQTKSELQNSELDTLRQIVFGSAQANIEQRIDTLEQHTQQSLDKIEKRLENNIQQIKVSMEDGFNKLEDKLALADHSQDQKSAELNNYADRLSSALDMLETNTKQDNDVIHDRLDKEIQKLTEHFATQLNEALNKLNQVSSELNSSKTDRKLAKLLASVASDLETGGNE